MSTTLTERVAAEIRAEMARKQVKGTALAAAIGRPQQTVSRWTKGKTPLTIDELDTIARALDLSIPDLLSRASGPTTGGGAPVLDLRRDGNRSQPTDGYPGGNRPRRLSGVLSFAHPTTQAA